MANGIGKTIKPVGGPVINLNQSLWRKILRYFSRKSKARKEMLDLKLTKREHYAKKYMADKNIKTDKDLVKAIKELEEMEDEKIYNIDRKILIEELNKELLYRNM